MALWTISLGLACSPVVSAQDQAGGSNYVIVDPDLDKLRGDGAWRNSHIFAPPACSYDRSRPVVDEDLRQMRAAGQRKLALVVWHMTHSTAADCAGFTVSSNGGVLAPRVLGNIVTLLEEARRNGFDEVQIRFAPMGGNSPYKWKAWSQEKFDENWSLIRTTVEALRKQETPKLTFDLGVELAGTDCGSCSRYVQAMWRNFVERFGPDSSYGFSVAVAPGRVGRLLRDLRQGGALPREIALDVYKNPEKAIERAAREARDEGITQPVFIIQETYYDNSDNHRNIRKTAKKAGVRIRAIMQWPVTPGANRHISVPKTYAYPYSP